MPSEGLFKIGLTFAKERTISMQHYCIAEDEHDGTTPSILYFCDYGPG
jgi:hypothetical protein